MIKPLAIAIAAVIVTGCGTPADMRMKAADLELNSKRSAKDVAVCISEKWQSTKPTMTFYTLPVSMSFTKHGFSVMVNATGGLGNTMTVVIADIDEYDSGSITVYHRDPIGYSSYDEAVTDCNL